MASVKYSPPWSFFPTFPILQSKLVRSSSLTEMKWICALGRYFTKALKSRKHESLRCYIYLTNILPRSPNRISIGSAVQIALFVLPGSVLIGWAMDRSMSLYFRGFETCCLIFSVVSVAAVLQGGTTNWLVGAYLLGVYFMVAAGFWFHELENLSVDGELLTTHNYTRT